MTIIKTTIRELEHALRKPLPDELKRYLLAKYKNEPFPYEFSEQDLYSNICRDICAYETGKLDVKINKPHERWQEEREYLQNLYVEKCHDLSELEEYVSELELILSEYGLESSRMAEKRVESKLYGF